LALLLERQQVHDQTADGERNEERDPPASLQTPLESEKCGQKRQDEKAGIANVEPRVFFGADHVLTEELRCLECDGRADGQQQRRGRVTIRADRCNAGTRRNHELLPEAFGVLVCELA
jgi:hypothetical protein